MCMTPLLEARGVRVTFTTGGGFRVPALRGVSLEILRGESMGLVGETGSGKSTLGRVLLGLLKPEAGEVRKDGKRLQDIKGKDRLEFRRRYQMVFQQPLASLNPFFTVAQILDEPLAVHGVPRRERRDKMDRALEQVNLLKEVLPKTPRQLSGGQRQRTAIARGLLLDPCFIALDEPVSALDLSVQAQVLNLLKALQESLDLTYLLISHDVDVVAYLCRKVAVMYAGRIVELGSADSLFTNALHPYTRRLLSAKLPDTPGQRSSSLPRGKEELGAAIPLKGCAFAPRCDQSREQCLAEDPVLQEAAPGHWVACPFAGKG